MAAETYDAIIVGGGHNGLVAGFYLARAGLSTLILERRPFVGGPATRRSSPRGSARPRGPTSCPCFARPSGATCASPSGGIVADPAGPTFRCFPDGAHYSLGDDMASNVEEPNRFSAADAAGRSRCRTRSGRMVQSVIPSFNWTAPDPRMRRWPDLREFARWGGWAPAAQAPRRSRVPVLDERRHSSCPSRSRAST